MSETLPKPLPAGGQVLAIIPQTIEETFRLAKGVVTSGLAPYSLVGKIKTSEDTQRALSAVAIVIMAGAELGLPPMVSLRSFTVINGRPALYGDGLINVVRRSGRAKELKMGWTYGGDYRLFIRAGRLPEPEGDTPEEIAEDRKRIRELFEAWPVDERTGGFCEAERKDSGERKATVFTVAEAKRAGLWQEAAEVMKDVWENGNKVRKLMPNDSPWFRYRERMGGWRAAGYCLRDLFGDVLGGITDEWEAREISGMIDITPEAEAKRLGEETPSPDESAPPSPEEPPLHNSDRKGGQKNEGDTGKVEEKSGGAENSSTDDGFDFGDDGPADPGPQTPDEFLDSLKYWLDQVTTPEGLEETWAEMDVEAELTHAPDHLARAIAMRDAVAAMLEAK